MTGNKCIMVLFSLRCYCNTAANFKQCPLTEASFHILQNHGLGVRGGGGGGEGYSTIFRIGVCRERSQTLTLSKDKENEN